jgi:lipoate-protein ligase B
MPNSLLNVQYLFPEGPLSYKQGLTYQQHIHRLRVDQTIGDTVLFLEHSPTITLGRRGDATHILANESTLLQQGIQVCLTDRGGQVTFHGPGQLIMYCLIGLGPKVRQIRSFVMSIELAIIEYLQTRYGLVAHLEDAHPGIWLTQGKVAALGISVRERVSMHGLALNLQVDPRYFEMIIPCGIQNRPTISLSNVTSTVDNLITSAQHIAPILARHLGYAGINVCEMLKD